MQFILLFISKKLVSYLVYVTKLKPDARHANCMPRGVIMIKHSFQGRKTNKKIQEKGFISGNSTGHTQLKEIKIRKVLHLYLYLSIYIFTTKKRVGIDIYFPKEGSKEQGGLLYICFFVNNFFL